MTKRPETTYARAKRIRTSIQKADLSYTDSLYKFAQDTAITAHKFAADLGEWEKFCGDEFWTDDKSRPNPSNSKDAIRQLFKYNYGKGENNRKRASHHYRGVQALLDEDVKRTDIARELKRQGGWSKVVNESVSKRKSNDTSTGSIIQSSSKLYKRPFEKVIKDISDEAGLIAVEVDALKFEKLMELPDDKFYWLAVKNIREDPDGFINFEVIEIEDP